MRRAALLLLFLASGCATRPALRGDLHALLTRYESYGFSGTVLVVKDGRVVLHEGYGFADRERRIRNGPATLYEVASLNKTLTAAAILQLEARGALDAGDPLSRHLGAFPPAKAAATIHHLATHTAGLVPEGADLGAGTDREAFVENVKRVAPESAPGERYRYTNAGYSVLAAIVERLSGMPYETYVRERLTAPAGLRDVYFRGEPLPRPMALGYEGTPRKVIVPEPMRWGTRGAGGWITTVGDLHRWYLTLQANPEMRKMFQERPEQEGYAWHVDRDADGRRRIHKGGGMPQYATQIVHYPDDRLLIIWASNDLQQRWRQALNRGIAAVAFGTEAVAPPPRVAGGPALGALAGIYVAASGKRLQLAQLDDSLHVLANELDVPAGMPFFRIGEREFAGFHPTRLTLTRMTFDGDEVTVSLAGGQVVARKTP
jgi:CubicO group peptidase (beta-lactamase class C family)